ncbi:MAG: NAD(P)/FAD-dependent oxidoreductase [Candidatus Geothermincolia bacterium]
MSLESDVLVVGAGTAGTYIAWQLASLGYSCTVLEKDRLSEVGSAIGPFHMEEHAFEQFEIPLPEGPELLHRITRVTNWSPRFANSFQFSFPTLVMDKPLFTRRMHSYALEAGAELVEEAEVIGLIIEGGILRGVMAKTPGGESEWRARLVVDASGIDGVVRTMMPHTRWFENDPIASDDTIFVYMETWKDVESGLTGDLNSFPHYIGWCAPGPGDTRIVGVGMGGSAEAAKRRHLEMLEVLPVKGTVVGSTGGRIPYRRPPFSLVDNSLIVVGDAACMNKPFSGEGVTSGFTGCVAAVNAAAAALAADDLTRDALWQYNIDYFTGQGAKFAFLTAVLPAVMSAGPDEMEYLFSLPGLLTEEGALALQRDFEIASDTSGALKALPGIVRGLIEGRLRASTLMTIARMSIVGAALKALYSRYPETPLEFGTWMRRARFAWKRAERIKRIYFQKA